MREFAALLLCASVASAAQSEDITNRTTTSVSAGVVGFSDFTDFAMFQGAFGTPLTRIRFDEVPVSSIVSDQYESDGVVFTDGDDTTVAAGSFVEDGVGLGGAGRIHLLFSQPARAVGAFFPGGMTIEVFDTEGGISLHQSADFAGSGAGFFGGIVGDTDFRFVEIRDWVDDSVFIDDLVIGFAPPEGTIFGCIKVTDIPLTLNRVALFQPGEPRQVALTDANGCYVFDDPVPGKWFSIFILGTVVPQPSEK